MLISVVTVSFNSERTIAHTIESFLRQRHKSKELVIVDGASRDSTLKIVSEFRSPLIRVHSEPDRGAYDAINRGLDLFRGDAVGFLNSDDTFHDEEAVGAVAEALTEADIVYGDLLLVTDHSSKQVARGWRSGPRPKAGFRTGWVPPHPAFYVRRSVVDRVGRFNIKYRIGADYDFMLRAIELNDFRVRYIPRVIADFQLGGISTQDWRASVRGNLECLDSRRMHFGPRLVDAALFLRPLRRLLQVRSVRGNFLR